MNLSSVLIVNLKEAEGRRLTVYDDATGEMIVPGYTVKGVPTIGYGCNLLEPIPEVVADALLYDRAKSAMGDLDREVMWWRMMTQPRQDGLAEMAYQMGWPVLSEFHRMLLALKESRWQMAHDECLKSRWADQTDGKTDGKQGRRARRISQMFLNG